MTDYWMTYLCRAALLTTMMAILLAALLRGMRIRSPFLHRLACALILAQGWIAFLPAFHVTLPRWWAPAVSSPAGSTLPQPRLETSTIPIAASDDLEQARRQDHRDLRWALLLAWVFPPLIWLGIKVHRYARFVRWVPLGKSLDDVRWEDEWSRVQESCGIADRSQLRITEDVGPLLCFVPFFYLVLVPRGLWASLKSRQRETVLWHEALHIERHDVWKSLGARLLAMPQWFNPAVWWAVRRFDDAGEWACDDAVTLRLTESHRADYLTALLDAVDRDFGKPTGALAVIGQSNISTRIKRLVHTELREDSRMKRRIMLLLCALLAMLAVVRLDAHADAEVGRSEGARESPHVSLSRAATAVTTEYRLAPPDIVVIQSERLIPKTPYQIQPSDVLEISLSQPMSGPPVASTFKVDDRGRVTLGPSLGAVEVQNLTPSEASVVIAKQLSHRIADPEISVDVLQASGAQHVSGEHLIGPDGHVNLGIYGRVYVSGLNVEEARNAIEKMLSKHLDMPKVSVDVLVYNSKFYYIMTDRNELGHNVVRIPITGNETVLDAVAQVGGLQQVSSKRIWISRRAPEGSGVDQILPVDWKAITRGASMSTNYQILAGDRIFISSKTPDGFSTNDAARGAIRLELQVLLDAEGVLNEYAPLRNGNAMRSRSQVILPSLRIMANKRLVRVLSKSVIICESGTIATITVPSTHSGGDLQDLRLEINPTGGDGSVANVKWKAKLQNVPMETQSRASIEQGESVVCRIYPTASPYSEEPDDVPAVYLVMTRARL